MHQFSHAAISRNAQVHGHTGAPGSSGDEAARVLCAHRLEKLPLIDTHRRSHGLITKQDLMLYRQRPHASTDAQGRLLVGAAIGVRGDYLERAAELVEALQSMGLSGNAE